MSRQLKTVYVTHHALARWRERASVYGDEGPGHVEAALRAATCLDDEPLPFARIEGMRYYRHAENPDLYFITDTRGAEAEAVVTVVQVEKPAAPAVGPVPNTFPPAPAAPNPDAGFPKLAGPVEEREWLKGALAEAMASVSPLSKKHPARAGWVKWIEHLHFHLRVNRRAYKRELETHRNERVGEVIRQKEMMYAQPGSGMWTPSGQLNLSVAVRFLLGEVERLKSEVEQLKAGRAQAAA